MTTDVRDIFIATCKVLESLTPFVAKSLEFGKQIYAVPATTWLNSGDPLELQVSDGGDVTLDRDGSVRRGQLNIIIAILMRRPSQYEGQMATLLQELSDDLQTYSREIRQSLDGIFLPYSEVINVDPQDLLVRPLVYTSSSAVQQRQDYPDLMVKELSFTAGVNDAL